MTEEEFECLAQMYGYLSFADDRAMLYANGSPVSTFDPISPMICQFNQIAYNMADLANAYCSAPNTEQASRMDDICTQFATPYNGSKDGMSVADRILPLKPKNALEDFWDSLDIPTQCDIVNAMWMSFACGVAIPFSVIWLICDHFLPFF
jgi:hypothetical protein